MRTLALACTAAVGLSLLVLASVGAAPQARYHFGPGPFERHAPRRPDLGNPRTGHTATLLSDGRVVFAGGRGPDGPLGTLEIYDPRERSVEPVTGGAIFPRANHTATLLPDGRLLFAFGEDDGGALSSVEVCESPGVACAPIAGDAPRAMHTAALLGDGRALVFGGAAAGAPSPAVVFDPRPDPMSDATYDARAGRFAPATLALVEARRGHTTTLLPDGRVLVVGGANDHGELASAELLDPATGASVKLRSRLSTPRARHTATLLPNGSVLIAGGVNHGGALRSLELYDPWRRRFTRLPIRLKVARAGHTATLLAGGAILFAGGDKHGGVLADIERLDAVPWDFASPRVREALPADGAVDVERGTLVSVRFSEPIDPASISPLGVRLEADGLPIAGAAGIGSDGLQLFFAPMAPLAPGTIHRLVLAGLRDLAGRRLKAASVRFTTVFAPEILSFEPTHGPIGTLITVTGRHFDAAHPDLNVVTIGGAAAAAEAVASDSLRVSVPPDAAFGAAPIVVRTRGGATASAAPFTVESAGPAATRLMVSPGAASIATGDRQSFTATLTYEDGSSADVSATAAWSSGDVSVATVAAGGTATGVGQGQVIISAAAGGLTATAVLQVADGQALPLDPALIAPPINRTVATALIDSTAFLYSGPNAVQTGIAPGTIVRRRAAVVRGRVLTSDGAPLPGVTLTIRDHPELGATLSRLDGAFDLVVNGGGYLTVEYRKAGLLPAFRQIDVPWEDFVSAPDVALVPLDPAVTAVDLAAPTTTQVAQGSPVTDDDGTRQSALVFSPGTGASLVLPDGTTQAAPALSVRATEYTVGARGPDAMPAPLPPSSGYTYAVEFSADQALAAGAREVRFSEPVAWYVDNFLHFDVGGAVPVGVLDPEKQAWVPADNGRVIGVVAESGGLAELDVDGSGQPANAAALASLGIADEERLRIAELYDPGQSFWRMRITHFSAYDANWPLRLPTDAQEPNGGPPESDRSNEEDDPCPQDGSLIECENGTLGEWIPVAGTPFTLNYRSSRVPGRGSSNRLRIPLTGGSVPDSLKRVELSVFVAGQVFKETFDPSPNQQYTYHWDGRDAYGRRVQGTTRATVYVGFVYDGQYGTPSSGDRSFGEAPDVGVTGDMARGEITITRTSLLWLGAWDITATGGGGWTIDAQHYYDGAARVLYYGDGRQRSAENTLWRVMETAVGNGLVVGSGANGDGGPATEASIDPQGLRSGPDGSLYISDAGRSIRRVDPDGVITTITADVAGDLSAIGPDGSLYLADWQTDLVRRVAPDGTRSVVAGTGTSGYSGDGGPATSADLYGPSGVAVAPDGTLYIAEVGNSVVRKVSTDGIITTFAGDGTWGFAGDDGPATAAQLDEPFGLAVGPDGSVYVADGLNSRVRRITPDGVITTVAGNGAFDYGGDGGDARAAALDLPVDVNVTSDGTLFITEWGNKRVRRVTTDGIITTIAGSGELGFAGDGGPATAASMGYLQWSTVTPDGHLFVNDQRNARVRRVAPALPDLADNDVIVIAEDGSALYIFDSRGRHLRTIDALTNTLVHGFEYDGSGGLARIVDGDGNVTAIERAGDLVTAIVAPGGQRTALGVDGHGYLTSVSDPGGNTWRMGYQNDGLMTSFTTPNGHESTMTYDAEGLLVTDASAAGGGWTIDRDRTGAVQTTTMTTAEGRVFTYNVERQANWLVQREVVDPSGLRSVNVTSPAGRTWTTAPDGTTTYTALTGDPRFGSQAPVLKEATITTPGGLVASIVSTRTATFADPSNHFTATFIEDDTYVNGREFYWSYDAATRTLEDWSPGWRDTVTVFDELGRIASWQPPALTPVEFTYDDRGRVTALTQGTRQSTITYDTSNQPIAVTDPLGREVRFEYDGAGRVTKQTLPGGREIRFGYDANGNITSLTPPGRPEHVFTYTPVDLTATYAPPPVSGTGATFFEYNRDRQLTKIQRPDGLSIDFDFDAGGRLETVTTPRGEIAYSYAPTGVVETIESPDDVTLAYTYDGPLPTSESWTGPVGGRIDRVFDNNFWMRSEQVAGSDPISYTYDDDGLVIIAGDQYVNRAWETGFPTETNLRRVHEVPTFNTYGELMRDRFSDVLTDTTLFEVAFERDALGRITQRVEEIDGVLRVFGYGYDAAGRLAGMTRNGSLEVAYTYDANGNRLASEGVHGTFAGTYDDQDRLLTYGTATYSYTANGELATKTTPAGVTTYTYDVLGNLTRVELPDGRVITYQVDGRNRRVAKLVNGVRVRAWLYADQLRPIAELDGTGNVVSRFIYASRSNVPDYFIRDGLWYKIITDHLGSPRIIVDASTLETPTPRVVQRMDYDPFGIVTYDSAPGWQPFGFAGGLYDPDTKLVRFGARDYDAETGRWTSKDPIGFLAGDPNLFSYVFADPGNSIDPRGLQVVMRTTPDIQALEAVADFLRNYKKMRDANTIGADKYFHCMANCEASTHGVGGAATAKIVSEARELFDQYVKGDPIEACNADRAANAQGRTGATLGSCTKACGSLKPPSMGPIQ